MSEELAARVTRAMKMAGVNQNQLSLAVDVAPTTIADMRRGKTEPKYTTVFKIAEALSVDPVWLATGKGSPQAIPSEILADLTEVAIVGGVQAGVFSDALSFDGDVQLAVPKLPFSHIFGLEVRGDSMDLAYSPGSFVICTPLADYTNEVKSGDHVVVERQRRGEHEYTLKEITRDLAGRVWLNPKSTNDTHQPIMFDSETPTEDPSEIVAIHSVVVSDYRLKR